MPKYLIQATYTTQGIQGLVTDSASGRKAAVQAAIKDVGGKLELFYYSFGDQDAIIVIDLPDNVTAAAVGLTTMMAGGARIKTTALLTVEEVDRAIEINVKYRAPGK